MLLSLLKKEREIERVLVQRGAERAREGERGREGGKEGRRKKGRKKEREENREGGRCKFQKKKDGNQLVLVSTKVPNTAL